PEHFLEAGLERAVELGHGDENAELMQGGDTQRLAGDPTGHDAGEMLEGRVQVDGDAVEGHPLPDAHPDGGDLVLPPAAPVDPDADPARAPLAADIEAGEGADDPFLEIADI